MIIAQISVESDDCCGFVGFVKKDNKKLLIHNYGASILIVASFF